MGCAMAAKRGERRDADSAYDALTLKQRRFVDEYLVDLNATQAAIRAEYSERNADKIGPELLGKTRVAEAIQDRMAARAKRTEITQDLVLALMKRTGRRPSLTAWNCWRATTWTTTPPRRSRRSARPLRASS